MRAPTRLTGIVAGGFVLSVLIAAGGPRGPVAAGPGRVAEAVALTGSPVRVTAWDEVAPDGRTAHYYAISLDGLAWTRVRQTEYTVRLRYDEFDPLVRQPAVAAALALPVAEAPADQVEQVDIVQFITPPLEEYRAAIRNLGGTVEAYLADHCHLVRMTPGVADQVRALPFVRWVGPYEPAYRLEEALAEGLAIADDAVQTQRYNIMVFEGGRRQKDAVANRIAAIGGVVDRPSAGKRLLEATLTGAQLRQVAGWNEVQFIDVWGPLEPDMDIAREAGGANYVEGLTGFSGEGVRGEVLDIGFNTTHVDFASRPLIWHNGVGNVESHGASTSGIIFGDGTGDAQGRGLLPDGQGIIADTEYIFLGEGRYEHIRQLLGPPYFASFHSSSVGSPQTTLYTTISADMDDALFDWDLLHCQSQSNTGNQTSRPQAWAKNIVSVGAIRHMNTLTMADDCWGCGSGAASIGPAADGRIKPDLAFYYDFIFTTTAGSPVAYTTSFGGTSGATPITAGYFGLLMQMWSEGLFHPVVATNTVFENRPHMTTSKALMINTATQWNFLGPTHDLTRVHQGWGEPSIQNAYDLRDQMLIVNETDLLTNLGSKSYEVTVDPGEPAVKFTLVYADPAGNPASSHARINDLTLMVMAPGGAVYWGNNALTAGLWSPPGGVANTVDTVENVFVQNPAAGTWTATVSADELIEDSHVETETLDADYALVISGIQPVQPPIVILLPEGTPDLVPPGSPTDIAVTILDGAESVVPSTATLHYRFDSGDSFSTAMMTHDGGSDYTATLPGGACGSTPQFYFSAEGDGSSAVSNPGNAPTSYYNSDVGTLVTVVDDDFDVDMGWTVFNEPGNVDGGWDRGAPVGGGDLGDPPTDYDGSGRCWLTDNVDGNSDVDGDYTRLISPVFDLDGADATFHYALWYSNNVGSNPNADTMRVDISTDGGGSWMLADTVGPSTGTTWMIQSVHVNDVATPTSTTQIRFSVNDAGLGSVVEAGLDGFSITVVECLNACPWDCDGSGDGLVGVDDFLAVLAQWGQTGTSCHFAGGGAVGVDEFLDVLAHWGNCP